MNPVKFTDPTGAVEGHVWVCSKCRHTCLNEQVARECCDHRCHECNEPADRPWLKCQSCRDKDAARNAQARYDRAAKVSLLDYEHEYVVLDGDETGRSVEEWLDMDPEDRPEWAWSVSNIGLPQIDARDVVNLDDFHEDAHEDLNYDDLQAVLNTWVDRQNQNLTWYQQDGRIVLLNEGDADGTTAKADG